MNIGRFNNPLLSITDRQNGYVTIDLVDTEYVIDTNVLQGESVLLYKYYGSDQQLFKKVKNGEKWVLVPKNRPGKALDHDFLNKRLIFWSYHGGSNQLWDLQNVNGVEVTTGFVFCSYTQIGKSENTPCILK